jgi:hypothetical protein
VTPQTIRRHGLPLLASYLICSVALAQPADNRAKVLVGFRNRPGAAERAVIETAGGTVDRAFTLVNAVAARVPPQALQGLARNPLVSVVEPDGEFVAHNAELDAAWGVKRIGAGAVHDAGNRGATVKVCILDTGMQLNHPDLYLNYRGGRDFVNNDNDPSDDNGHGTHVAGTIAALMNGAGVLGAAPQVELYIYKVLGANGSGSFSNVIAALQECVAVGGKVTNNSYGTSSNPGSTVQAAFDNAAAAGVVHIASAGNSGAGTNTVGFPAQFSSVMAVAATDSADNRASFSSTGPAVEIAAPGVAIPSTYLNNGYASMSGTSMASPHVAGVAALVIGCGVTSPAAVRQRIRETALDLGASGVDPSFGSGLVRADLAAMNCFSAPAPVTDLSVSSVSAPGTVAPNTTVNVTVTVTNTGNQTASGFTVTLRDNGVFVGQQSVPALNAGQTTALSISWSTSITGAHTLQATLDGSDGNNANNAASTLVQVQQPAPISLTAVGTKNRGVQRVQLNWTGATGSNVVVTRTGASSATFTTANDGSHLDDLNRKGSGTYQYRVCEALNPAVCSATVTVVF